MKALLIAGLLQTSPVLNDILLFLEYVDYNTLYRLLYAGVFGERRETTTRRRQHLWRRPAHHRY